MQNTTIAVDGSLYRFHPRFKKNMERSMQMLVQPHIRVSFSILFLFCYIILYNLMNLVFLFFSYVILLEFTFFTLK